VDILGLRALPALNIVGLMSGSSCDGVDAALVRIEGTGRDLRAELLAFETLPYDDAFKTRLLDPALDVRDLLLLNVEVGERLAEAVLHMQRAAAGLAVEVHAVGSHGHTLAHVPPGAGERVAGTLQVGEPAVIAERSGLPVVSDFRARDMAAGGQGAPLVPYVDWLLFGRDDAATACLNIGGIANFTVVRPRLEDLVAFDTGPGNMPIDGAVRARSGRHYDADGEMAARGTVVPSLLERLLCHPFFERRPPKSTGREDFDAPVYLADALRDPSIADADLVATVTAAVAESIADAYRRFIAPDHPGTRIVVSGGGAHNPTLLARMRSALPGIDIRTSDAYGISADAKEALAFAILANETLRGTPANVPAATGAKHPAILGKITPV
jgi:anhydro-N-acetylmuramic acid kinase